MATGMISMPTKTEEFTPTVTKTSGNSSLKSISGSRSGNVVTISVSFTNGTKTEAGNNSFDGTISNVPLPVDTANGVGFYSATLFCLTITSTGAFRSRVLVSSGYWGASDSHTLTITYVCK